VECKVCPRCGAEAKIAGSTSPSEAPVRFRPYLKRNLWYWLYHFNGGTGVELREGLQACLSCGLVWGQLSAKELHDFITRERLQLSPILKSREAEL
jgi:hypothetical protein